MERRYHNLRRKLDQQGYKQYFDVESIDLVEKLYIELNQAKNGKLGNNGLTKGNADLQREIVKIKSEHENRIKVLNEAVRKQENEIYDLQFLNNQYSDKIQQLEEESKKKSERLHELEKNIHPTIQISEVDSVVPPSFNGQQKKPRPAQQNADQLKRLQLENDAIKNQLERANELIASLKDQMDGRAIQKDKLSKILRNDQAARGDLLHPCSDHLVAHLTFEMEHLQRLNYELEKRLKDVINTDKESQLNEHRHLSNKNKLLELNLADADQHAEALRKQKEELLAVADKEMNEAKEEIKLLYDKIIKFENEILNLKKENEIQVLGKNECMVSLATANAQLKSFEMIVKQLEEERNSLKTIRTPEDDKVGPKNSGDETYLANVIKSLEKQRDFYKRQLQNFSTQNQPPRKASDPLASTPFIKSNSVITDDGILIQWNPLISFLEEERDAYKNDCINLRKSGLLHSGEKGVEPDMAELKTRLQNANEENKELNKTLESLEKHIQEVNVSAEGLAVEKIALQKLYDKVVVAHQQQKEKALLKRVVPSLPETVAKFQAERDKAMADYQRAIIEIEVLRNKLKLATETQISERKRLEEKIADLESRQLTGDERAEFLAKITSSEVDLFNVNEENQHLNRRLADLETKMTEERARSSKLARDLSEKSERTLKDAEEILIKKNSERNQIENKVKDLENEIDELKEAIARRDLEINALKNSIMMLDSDKDKFQADIDDKTSKMANLNDSLNFKNKEIMDLKINVSSMERRLDQMGDELLQRDREIAALKREVDRSKRDVQEATKQYDEVNFKYHQINEDILVLTKDNQTLQRNLQTCQAEKELLKREVQEYVNEVGRVEQLLRSKEEERTDLFEQFKNLSAATTNLEYQNNNLESQASNSKMELLAKQAELSHSKDTISSLNQEIKDYFSRQQNYEQQLRSAQHSLSDMQLKFQDNIQEKSRLQRELSALRDLNVKLNMDKEDLIKDTRNKEKELAQLEVALVELRQEVDSSRIQLNAEKTAVKSLEQLLASNRQKDYQIQLSNRELTDELAILKEKLRQAESKLTEVTSELSKHRSRSVELQMEIDKLKRQLIDARFEREKLNQEIQKIRQLSPRLISPTYVVTTTVTETRTTSDNPLVAPKTNKEEASNDR